MSALLEERNGDSFYLGPLEPAKRVVEANEGCAPQVTSPATISPVGLGSPYWLVTDDSHWGTGTTEEEAWRFYLGAAFGPADDEYDEAHLRRLLEANA